MEFLTPFTVKEHHTYKELCDYIIEPSGQLDTKTQIDSFTRAGMLLASVRTAQYGSDVSENPDDPEISVMNTPNLDYTDIKEIVDRGKKALKEIEKAQEEQEEKEKKEKDEKTQEALKKADLYDQMKASEEA